MYNRWNIYADSRYGNKDNRTCRDANKHFDRNNWGAILCMATLHTKDQITMIYKIKNLNFHYPKNTRKVLKDVSLELSKGEILSILGPNGSGKTTLLNCMIGLLKPQSGEIFIEGESINKLKIKEVARRVSYVPQMHIPTFDYSVLEIVLMGRASKLNLFEGPSKSDREFCLEILEDMGLSSLKEKSYLEISGGERQQALIARAIAQEPKAILFDEPTAHLDYGNQYKVLKSIKKMSEKGYGIIMTTHNPEHALLLDDAVALVSKNGHVECGKSQEILTEERLKQVYQRDLRLMRIQELDRVACLSPKL